ncbi:hypothetical protein, partial [Cupriavidus sp. SK-3]|uniref:hypothetical protein n=1 Tax=Cupriavidus sp. SK-3 TaxID=1470558 RepID=UPI001F292F48
MVNVRWPESPAVTHVWPPARNEAQTGRRDSPFRVSTLTALDAGRVLISGLVAGVLFWGHETHPGPSRLAQAQLKRTAAPIGFTRIVKSRPANMAGYSPS